MIQAQPIQREALWSAFLIAVPAFAAMRAGGEVLTLYQVQSQDAPVMIGCAVLILGLALHSPRCSVPTQLPSNRSLIALGLACVLGLGAGTYWLMGNFPVSRDEQMVVFDMAVFGKWQLATPLVPQWREYAQALVPDFLINSDHPAALVSDYLPMNAMLRLAFAQVADPAFFNPCLVLLGGIALWDIAARIFGDDVRARWVVLLAYGLSSQMLVTAMTTYAMTAHMALNLLWLAAFLRGGKAGHSIAIFAAFLAVGLHQIVFHPIFAAPFIVWRLREGQWKTVLLYGAGYLCIFGWWATYPHLVTQSTGVSALGSGESGSLLAKVKLLLLRDGVGTLPLMMLNFLRFFAWQHLALLPLLVAAAPLACRERSLAGPLWWGTGGLIFLVTFMLPYQGHGWGYRYLHPFLGSFALLAGFGYRQIADRVGRQADGMVLVLSGATLCLSVPWLFATTYAFVKPHVSLEHLIAGQKTRFVVVDTEILPSLDGRWTANAVDHVRNLPDLSNAPLRFSSRNLTPQMLASLCDRGTVSAVARADMRKLGFATNSPVASPELEKLMRGIADRPCLRRPNLTVADDQPEWTKKAALPG
jgi:hypothetical protein